MESRLRFLLLLPPAIATVFVFVYGWPGAVQIDTVVSICEGRDFVFVGHQEPMCGLLWGERWR